MRSMQRSSVALIALTLAALQVMPAVAVEDAADGGYPLETDGEVLDRDVTVEDDVVEVADVAGSVDDTAVKGRVLALTGTQIVWLVVAGLVLLGVGGVGLAAGRRRRDLARAE